MRRVGVGADLEGAVLVGPGHQSGEIAGHGGRDGRNLTDHDVTGCAVDRQEIALVDDLAVDRDLTALLVDGDGATADDAGLAPASGDDRRVTGLAAGGREDANGLVHPGDVFGAGLLANQQNRVVGMFGRVLDRRVRREDDLAAGRARAGGNSTGRHLDLGLRIELGQQQVIQAIGIDPLNGRFLVDEAFLHHLDGDPHRGGAGPLAGPRLEHVEGAVLHGELDVLHLLVVGLEFLADLEQLLVDLGHVALELVDVLGRSNAGDHVLALGVDQVVAEEFVLAGVRVPREGHAGAGVGAGVAEDHGLHVDGGSFETRDPLDPAVLDRLLAHPAIEDGHDGLPELVHRVLGEVLADELLVNSLVTLDEFLEVVGVKVGVELDALLLLEAIELMLEVLVIDAHGGRAEHVDDATVPVKGESLVVGLPGQPGDRGVGQAEIQNRVHHARHGHGRAGADADQERIVGIAEPLADRLFHGLEGRLDLGPHLFGKRPPPVVVGRADLGRDGESRWNRDADETHLGEVRPLAAEEVFHLGRPLGLPSAE